MNWGTGWVDDPQAVTEVMTAWTARAMPTTFAAAAPNLMAAADDAPVFFWQAEELVLGKRLETWDQKSVGSCVGFGNGRCAQDLMLWEIAAGEPEQYPGTEVCPEVIYGGSRVEVGGGRINGDGSVGAWAAEFLMRWGIVVRGVYGNLDLTRYSETTCRSLGNRGLSEELETVARVHPVRAAAMVTTKDEGWAAVGGGKPVVVCSNRGFTTHRDVDGYCSPSGVWNHCMTTRGRFIHPSRGKSVVLGNSWDDYLGSTNAVVRYVEDGVTKTMTLPPGHFATTLDVWGGMLAQRDSFALAGMSGWAKSVVDWTP